MENLAPLHLRKGLAQELQAAAEGEGLSKSALTESVAQTSVNSRETRLYQVSSTAALVQGVVQGGLPSDGLRNNGNFGVGTFDDLNGEMVILDGEIYQM